MTTHLGQEYLPGHVRARIRTLKHLAITPDDRDVLVELCKSHKTTDALRNFSPGNLRQQMEGLSIRLVRAAKRLNQSKLSFPSHAAMG